MFIPNDINLCPSNLIKRDFGERVTSTAQSFRSWDTCMDNTACKVIAIVGIVLAVLFCFWIISTIIRCLCLGFSCLEALCCCCCRSASRGHKEKQLAYENPNMYAPPHQTYQPAPQPFYDPSRNSQPSVYDDHSYRYEPTGYHVADTRDPFADKETAYKGR